VLLVSAIQVQTALGAILRDAKAKELPCGVFGSFGWSGEAVDELESRLKVRGPICAGFGCRAA
jgi:flavorubredoxin